MDARVFPLMSLAGFILVIAGFAGYAFDPQSLYLALFVIGVVALMTGYVALLLLARVRPAAEEEVGEVQE